MATTSQVSATVGYIESRLFTKLRPLPAFRTVPNGKASQINLMLGTCYESFLLRFMKGAVPATAAEIINEVANIKCVFDGDALIDDSAEQLLATQGLWKDRNGAACVSVQDGCMVVDLTRPWEQEIAAQDGPGLGTGVGVGGIRNASLEYTLAAGSTITLVDGQAEESDAAPLGRHYRRYHIIGNQAGAGDLVIDQWPMKDPSIAVYAFHLKSSVITDVKWYADKATDIEKMPYAYLKAVQSRYGLTHQTGWTHIVFNRRGRPREGLPITFQDGRLTLTTSAALGQYDIIAECVEGVDP